MAVGAIFEPDHVNSIIDGRPRRPVRARAAAPRRPVLDAARRGAARLRRPCAWPSQYLSRQGAARAQPRARAAEAAGAGGERMSRAGRTGRWMNAGAPLAGSTPSSRAAAAASGSRSRTRLAALGASLSLVGRDRARLYDAVQSLPDGATATRTSATSPTRRRSRARSRRSRRPGRGRRSWSTTPASRRARRSRAPTTRSGAEMLDVNLTGAFHCVARGAARLLEAGGAHRQRREHRRAGRLPLRRGVLRGQARRRRPHARARARARVDRRDRQRRVPGLHRHRPAARRGGEHRRGDRSQRGRRARRARRAQPAGAAHRAGRGRRRGRVAVPARVAAITGQAIVVAGGETAA